MYDSDQTTSERSAYVDTVLEGGPAGIPLAERQRRAGAEEWKIKLPYCGGYEHFERTGDRSDDADGQSRSVYRWVYRTCIAE